jgi:hypothetical protein
MKLAQKLTVENVLMAVVVEDHPAAVAAAAKTTDADIKKLFVKPI